MTTEHSIARQSTYRVRLVHDARIPTAEPGVTLGANLFLPVTDEPVPAVVTILHNAKDGIAGIGGAPYLEYFASRGFASVLVDRLGTGTSDGRERPAFDPGDGDDGVAVVEWTGAQDWCTGRVGMWGLSYGAINTLRTASRRPPALKAIVPIMGMLDPERDFVHPVGERGAMSYFGLAGVWNLFIQLQPAIGADPTGAATRRWEERVRLFDPWLMEAWRLRPGDPRWRERVIDAAAIEVPALCVAGWHDVFLDGTMRAYEQIRAPKRLVVGPWMHELPNESPREPVDIIELACDWWRRWLVDESVESTVEAGEEPSVVHLGGARSSWAEFPTWPPPVTRLVLTTTAEGGLHEGAPAGVPPRLLRWAADRTVGALSGLGTIPLAGFGFPLDQHDDDSRSLSFTTEPLPDGLVIAGTATAEVVVGARTTATRCVAKLSDVDPYGRSTLIAVGVAAVPVAPATAEPVTVTLNPAGYDVAPGHRLRLVLSDSDLPRLWPAGPAAHLEIAVGGLAATRVDVPVAEPTARVDGLLRPADLPQPFAGEPPSRTWRIERDHATGAVTVTIGDAAAASLSFADEDLRLERQVEITLHVAGDEGPASLTGSGRLAVTDAAGRRTVVTARTRVDEEAVTAAGEVHVDGALLVSRRWSE
jgi:putative CocE/NonD family hydrolase